MPILKRLERRTETAVVGPIVAPRYLHAMVGYGRQA
jgi:hypothetical protein